MQSILAYATSNPAIGALAFLAVYAVLVAFVLLFLAGAKRASWSDAEQAADDDAQAAWLKAQLAKKAS